MIRAFFILILLTLPRLAAAQDSENGAILSWIEESISTPGRTIRIYGVEGALSSSARIAEITISDSDGVWLQILGAQIDWSRRALLSGRLDINLLRADEINVLRRPAPITTPDMPTAEAAGFALPDLPVDIQIDQVTTDHITLGEGIVGVAATLSLDASFQLTSAGLATTITATRLDGPGGQVALNLSYDRASTHFDIDGTVTEPAGGVIANALNIDNAPPLQANLTGQGVLDDLTVNLAVDVGDERLIDGQVSLAKQDEGRNLAAYLNGQIAGLIPSDYRSFFEGQSALELNGLIRDGGGMALDQLTINTAQLRIDGSLDTSADGFPREVALTIDISGGAQTRVTLPFGDGISVASAALDLQFGKQTDGSYALSYAVQELSIPGFSIAQLAGEARGTALNLNTPDSRDISGTISSFAQGVQPESAATATALGDQVVLSAQWDWAAGGPLNLSSAVLQAKSAALRANGRFSGVNFIGDISAAALDMAPFSALAGRELSGALSLSTRGSLPLLGGQIDASFAAQSQDLRLNHPQLDALLAGAATISGHLLRDETGLNLTDAAFNSPLADITLSGGLRRDTLDLTLQSVVNDLTQLIPQLTGAARLNIVASGPLDAVDVQAELNADTGFFARLTGQYGAALDLVAQFRALPLDAAALVAPELNLAGQAAGRVTMTGSPTEPRLGFDVTLANLTAAPLQDYDLPPLDIAAIGTANAEAINLTTLTATGGGLQLDAAGLIPFSLTNLNLRADGQAPLSLSRAVLADAGISLTGQAQFSLTMTGALADPQLAGRVSTSGASLSAPAQRVQLENIDLAATLSSQTITLTQAEADKLGGGHISLTGQVGLGAGFPADLQAEARALRYSDGQLFTVLLDANLNLRGPLATAPSLSGRIDVLNAEFQVPSGSALAADLPEITHINVPRPVRRTQERAGLTPSGQVDAPFNPRFDLTLSAPSRIFLRGRGLDTELGGTLQLTGSLNSPSASGQFNLLRGRMDLLGQRIEFTQGSARLAGSLIPMLDLRAETQSNNYTISLQLVGPANAPEIILSSAPDLPQDEVLAQLIFARGIDALSPFQIAQLAASIAELSGQSNGGLISNLRRAAGLDNLDIQSSGGETSVTAGSYLRDNLYTEVEINSGGDTNLSINLDIIDGLKGRAAVGTDGETGLGIYFERDY